MRKAVEKRFFVFAGVGELWQTAPKPNETMAKFAYAPLSIVRFPKALSDLNVHVCVYVCISCQTNATDGFQRLYPVAKLLLFKKILPRSHYHTSLSHEQ